MISGPTYYEKELLQQVASGDEAAFAQLFHAWRDKLYSYLIKVTQNTVSAEDIVQDTFLKIWSNREALNNVDHFGAYLYRMTRNRALNAMRRQALEGIILTALRKDASNSVMPPDEQMLHKQLQEKLTEAIDNLPPQQKLIYTMVRQDELSYEEVSIRLQLSTSTIKNHMTLALRSIRVQMQAHASTAIHLLAAASLLGK